VFDAFNRRQIQDAQAMLSEATSYGIETVADMLTALASAEGSGSTEETLQPVLCQDCASELRPWLMSSQMAGVPIIGCKGCRYSRMLKGDELIERGKVYERFAS